MEGGNPTPSTRNTRRIRMYVWMWSTYSTAPHADTQTPRHARTSHAPRASAPPQPKLATDSIPSVPPSLTHITYNTIRTRRIRTIYAHWTRAPIGTQLPEEHRASIPAAPTAPRCDAIRSDAVLYLGRRARSAVAQTGAVARRKEVAPLTQRNVSGQAPTIV